MNQGVLPSVVIFNSSLSCSGEVRAAESPRAITSRSESRRCGLRPRIPEPTELAQRASAVATAVGGAHLRQTGLEAVGVIGYVEGRGVEHRLRGRQHTDGGLLAVAAEAAESAAADADGIDILRHCEVCLYDPGRRGCELLLRIFARSVDFAGHYVEDLYHGADRLVIRIVVEDSGRHGRMVACAQEARGVEGHHPASILLGS